jgi:hypothetical protein
MKDFQLMIKNAKTFNEEGSEVYNDATTLQKYFDKYAALGAVYCTDIYFLRDLYPYPPKDLRAFFFCGDNMCMSGRNRLS